MWTSIYSPQMGNKTQTKVKMLPKPNLAKQWVLLGCLQEHECVWWGTCEKWLKDSHTTKRPPRVGDSLWKLEPWSALYSQLAGSLICQRMSSRQLCWPLPFPGCLASLNLFQAALHVWEHLPAVLTSYVNLGKEGPTSSFGALLKLLSSLLLSFYQVPCTMECFTSL